MPTLIRFVVFIAILAGLGLVGMLALTFFVNPGQKQMTVRIPARELQVNGQRVNGPINVPRPLVNSDAPANGTATPANTASPPANTTAAPANQSGGAPANSAPIAPGANQDAPE